LRYARDADQQAFMGSILHQLGILYRERGAFDRALMLFTVMLPCLEDLPSRLKEAQESLTDLVNDMEPEAYQAAKARADAKSLQEVVSALLEADELTPS
jgi:hypothetical protein